MSKVTIVFRAAVPILLASSIPGWAQRPAETRAREIERMVHIQINRARTTRGFRPLDLDLRLVAAARLHSRRMAETGFFDHEDPELGSLAPRLRRLKIGWSASAENISYARDPSATAAQHAREAVAGWMEGALHKRNLLNPRLTRTGIGAHLNGSGELHLTQIFIRK